MRQAIQVWEESGFRGECPYDLLAYLDPERGLPFMASHPKLAPPNTRWLNVAVDLSRPLGSQLAEIQARCEEICNYTLLLAGQKRRRPGRHEISRDVLVFTLHYSAGLTTAQVAKKVFPKEDQGSAKRKVKEIIRRVHRGLDAYLECSQQSDPTQTK